MIAGVIRVVMTRGRFRFPFQKSPITPVSVNSCQWSLWRPGESWAPSFINVCPTQMARRLKIPPFSEADEGKKMPSAQPCRHSAQISCQDQSQQTSLTKAERMPAPEPRCMSSDNIKGGMLVAINKLSVNRSRQQSGRFINYRRVLRV